MHQFIVKKETKDLKHLQKVQYVARVGNFIDGGEEYTGALQILKVILSYDYLWQKCPCERRSLWMYE